MIYNPFMIDRHLNPRASGLIVFGGGGGSAPAPTPAPTAAPAPAPPPPVFKSSYPELQGKEYSSAADMQAAEKEVDFKKTNEGKLATFKSAVDTASKADTGSTDKIGTLQQQIQGVQAVPSVTFEGADAASFTEKANAYKTSKSEALNQSLAKAQQQSAAEVAAGQRKLVKTAITDPSQLTVKQDVSTIDPATAGTSIGTGTGQVAGAAPTATTATPAATTMATAPTPITAATVDPTMGQPKIETALDTMQPAQGVVGADSTVTAATMQPTDTAVSDLAAAQGTSIVMNNPVNREIQQGEIITGVADAAKASAYTEQVQAATATPSDKATVQGQLTDLMQDFEGGATPTWAAGAMRAATAQMAARGLGASSMAGQAIVQAAMEAALPIAAADAQTVAGFEMANLSNRQQRAMLAAQQRAEFMGMEFDQAFQAKVQNASRIADVANMNFTAEQQIALENSRNANSINMANLTNRQAMVMGQAAAISNLEMANLSNQQQAAVQNAQSFLQMDMANLNNRQQSEVFKAQTLVQSILTDQAAANAAKQFNASSENQTNQFMTNMHTQVSQFNATQANAMEQFATSEENAISKFNAAMRDQRDQFNANNQLVVAQANAQWRQNVATTNTTAQNLANAEQAKIANAFTASTIDQIWQRERDIMSMAWKSSESSADRANNIVMAQMGISAQKEALATQQAAEKSAAVGSFFSKLLFFGV